MDTGGLAQMAYQPFSNNTSIGVSGPGFASRGKASHIKRLSVASPPTIDETQQANSVSTPRTARGHLLAGLRTAPKSASAASASNGLDQSRYAEAQYNGSRVPQTTTSAYFPQALQMNGSNNNYHPQSFQEHVLAPPVLDFGGQELDGIDPAEYEQLMATNRYLAMQQRQLQQQLAQITSAAQQFGNLNINTGYNNFPQYGQSVGSPAGIYQQQVQQGLQPIVQPVPGSPGMYSVYNPMTRQTSIVYDNSLQLPADMSGIDNYRTSSPQAAPSAHRQNSDPSIPRSQMRSVSPPKSTQSPQTDVEPLPPPSANAFRRGHRKNMSSANIKTGGDWARPATGPRSAGFPATPATGTFGPGHGRAGDHPVRQPKGPPLLQELEEKPTSKHEGSKNFAARQRRQAVHDLVKAGRERRSDTHQPTSGAGTPGSEGGFSFSSASASDTDSVLAGSTTLTSRTSIGSIGMGAIGSERKEKSRDRSSVDSNKSLNSEDPGVSRRPTPLLVLSNAETRRSMVM
jgi:hypothetical protein